MVRIATDASSDTVFKGSMCFVAGNGDYRLRTRKTTASTDELELEALTLALKYLLKIGSTKAVIESDSVAALDAINHILHKKARKRPDWDAGGEGYHLARAPDSNRPGTI